VEKYGPGREGLLGTIFRKKMAYDRLFCGSRGKGARKENGVFKKRVSRYEKRGRVRRHQLRYSKELPGGNLVEFGCETGGGGGLFGDA